VSPIKAIKRSFQAAGCLIVLGVAAIGGISSYVERNPETKERLEISERVASDRIDHDAGFFTKVGALISAWWESDDLVEEVRTEKAEAEQDKAARRKEAEARRFNDSSYNSEDDYYAGND